MSGRESESAQEFGRYRDFEMECTWLTAVADRKTVGGFPHVAWRTAGDIAGRVAGRLESGMPCMFDGLTAIGVDETGHRKGHTYITVVVDHERKRVIRAHDGYGKQVPGLFFEELTPEQRAPIRIAPATEPGGSTRPSPDTARTRSACPTHSTSPPG